MLKNQNNSPIDDNDVIDKGVVHYYNPFLNNGTVLSVDNLRIKFLLHKRYLDSFIKTFLSVSRVDIEVFPNSTNRFKFRHLFSVTYTSDGFKMVIGFQFNGSDRENDPLTGYLDFNPNKIAHTARFWADYAKIKSMSRVFECVRCDIAFDIPVKREYVVLAKDSRKYALEAYNFSNKTEYLGRRSTVGYVKIYNKTEESGLDYDLTRIEVTCEPTAVSFKKYFPKVWDITHGVTVNSSYIDELADLNETDKTILNMELRLLANGLDEGLMLFNSLARIKKQKLAKFLLPESCLVFPDFSVVNQMFINLKNRFL